MNKSDLIKEIAFKANIANVKAGHALDAIIANIADELANDRSVVLVGFGTFSLKKRAARNGRNPKTGEIISINAAKIPSFKPGKTLKEIVNE